MAKRCGRPLTLADSDDPALTLAFPGAADVASADLGALRMPGARKQALTALAEAAKANSLLFQPLDTIEDTVQQLCAIRGIGDWTAHYIALRAVRDPDAFPASDVGLLRAARSADGTRPSPTALRARAEHWRPFRAYAAQHLWTEDECARSTARTMP